MMRRTTFLALLAGALALPVTVHAQGRAAAASADGFARGEVIEVVETLHDPAFTYALYVPTSYTADKAWPVLYVLDPRGRAVMALELFRQAAERNGFLVVSSYQSRSDTDVSVTTNAFQALLNDVPRRFAFDPQRLVLAGMSGTAHAGWKFGQVLGGRLAGVIAAAGAVQTQTYGPPEDEVPFAYYGITMTDDFNYQETMQLSEHLDKVGSPHHFEVVAGRHGWPPEDATERALDWITMQFVRAGFPPPNADFVSAQVETRRRHAQSIPDPLERLRHYASLRRDFAETGEFTTEDEAELRRLVSSDEVAEARKLERRLAKRETTYLSTTLADWQRQMQVPDGAPDVAHSKVLLHLGRLQKQADDPDPRRAASGRRLLENVFTVSSYYLPLSLERKGQISRAETSLLLAAEVFPDRAWVWWRLANLHVDGGRTKRAIEYLARALDSGFGLNLDQLREDPRWEEARSNPAWGQVEAAALKN